MTSCAKLKSHAALLLSLLASPGMPVRDIAAPGTKALSANRTERNSSKKEIAQRSKEAMIHRYGP